MAVCNISSMYAPNGKQSKQFSELRAQFADPVLSVDEINKNALQAWLIPYTLEFVRAFGDFTDQDTWNEANPGTLDKNGEVKSSFYMNTIFVKDPKVQAQVKANAERYVTAADNLDDKVHDVQDQLVKALAKLREREPDNSARAAYIEETSDQVKSMKGQPKIRAMMETARLDIDNDIALLDQWMNAEATPENTSYALVVRNRLRAYEGLTTLRDALVSDHVLNTQHKESIRGLDRLITDMNSSLQKFHIYESTIISRELSALSINMSVEDISDAFRVNTSATSGLTKKGIYAGDSADSIVALVAKYISKGQYLAMDKTQVLAHRMNLLVDELQEIEGTDNAEKLYDKFLEKKDGKVTGYLIGHNIKQFRKFKSQYEGTRTYDIYFELSEIYTDLNKLIPKNKRMGDRIPTLRKSLWENAKDSENKLEHAKEHIKDTLGQSTFDTEFGEIVDASGQPLRQIPVFFTSKRDEDVYIKEKRRLMDVEGLGENTASGQADLIATRALASETSLDLGNTIQAFGEMAYNYQEMQKMLFVIEGSKELVYLRANARLDHKGNPILDTQTDASGRMIKDRKKESAAYDQLETLIEMQVYGIKVNDLGTIGNTSIKYTKVIKNITEYSSLLLMGGNMLAAATNIAMGETMQWAEGWAGVHYGNAEYRAAHMEYGSSIVDMVGDSLKRNATSRINVLSEKYDVLGNYMPDQGKATDKSVAKKVFTKGAMLFMQSAGEHSMQSKAFIAFMRSQKAYNAEGEHVGNLWEAHKVTDKGVMEIDPDTHIMFGGELKVYDMDQRARVSRNVQAMLRQMHGNYNAKTAADWQQSALWGMVGQFRKWVPTGIQRRFGKKYFNEMADMEYEGNYRTVARYLLSLSKQLREISGESQMNWSTMSELEKANIKRTVFEASVIISTIGALKVLDLAREAVDDDDDSAASAILAASYVTARLQTEILAFILPSEALSLLRTPAVTINVAESAGQFAYNLARPWEWDTDYEAGRHKGRSKLAVSGEKLIPLYKQLDRLSRQGLEAQAQFYK